MHQIKLKKHLGLIQKKYVSGIPQGPLFIPHLN